MSTATCWILSDGKAGMENQCLGLAERLGLKPEIKRIVPRFPWTVLPPQLWVAPLAAPGPKGDRLAPPWPDILIATGRQTVAPALAIKRGSGGKTRTIQIQHPRVALSRFDLVIAPAHDGLSGPNVISTLGAMHRITAERLKAAADEFRESYADLPRPLIAVLLGGSNSQYRMTAAASRKLGGLLAEAARETGAGIAVTPSRRTGEENIEALAEGLSGVPHHIWDGTGENPYFGMLALADGFVVTNDSVNMVSEAAATGKPVHIFDLEGHSAKFDLFHKAMRDAGATRPFAGKFESWSYDPPDDLDAIATDIKSRFGLN